MRNTSIGRSTLVLAVCAFITLGAVSAFAQPQAGQRGQGGPGGQFDPAQFAQMRMNRTLDQLGIEDEGERSVIGAAVQKVFDAEQQLNASRMGGMMGGMMGGRRAAGGQGGQGGPGGQGGAGRMMGGAEPPAAMTALREVLEKDDASADDIKAKLKAYRDWRDEQEKAVEKQREELKKLLSAKQEAAAVLAGILR